MELYFNELSIKHREKLDYNTVGKIVEVYKVLKNHCINTCRINTKDSEKLFAMISENSNTVNIKNFYYSFFKLPFESMDVIRNEEEYYKHIWCYQEENCFGMAIAYIMNSICYSIFHDKWSSRFIEIKIDDGEETVNNISIKEHAEFHLSNLREESDLELVECDISCFDKKIHLREDHGIDKLSVFANKLVHSPYVIEIVNSLPYNPYTRKFIKEIKDNGLIELVLPWTDEGLGLVIKTTGRTKEETNKIAQILEEKYGYI